MFKNSNDTEVWCVNLTDVRSIEEMHTVQEVGDAWDWKRGDQVGRWEFS